MSLHVTLYVTVLNNICMMVLEHPQQMVYFGMLCHSCPFIHSLQTHLIMCSRCMSRFHPRKEQNISVVNRLMKSWKVPPEKTNIAVPPFLCCQSLHYRSVVHPLGQYSLFRFICTWLTLHHHLGTSWKQGSLPDLLWLSHNLLLLVFFWFPTIPKLATSIFRSLLGQIQ